MLRLLAAWLRRRTLSAPGDLAGFIASETARITQKATTGYCRAKAGANVDLLFREPSFLEALETCRWGAFGLVLADICLVAEGVLRPWATGREEDLAEWVTGVFDAQLAAHPRPGGGADGWAAERAEFRARLARSRLAEPIPAAHVGFDTARRIYESLPVHPRLRREDYELVQNLMRFGHITFREELERRLDAARLVALLPCRAAGREDNPDAAAGEAAAG